MNIYYGQFRDTFCRIHILALVAMLYTKDFRYIPVIYNAIVHTAQQLQR